MKVQKSLNSVKAGNLEFHGGWNGMSLDIEDSSIPVFSVSNRLAFSDFPVADSELSSGRCKGK